MTALEEQLRAELRAEAEVITPDSLGDLLLPANRGRTSATLRRGGLHRWPAWAKPLAAAAAVVAVVIGTFTAAGSVSGTAPSRHTRALYAKPPTYYAYTVPGDINDHTSHGTPVTGRSVKVRATFTGKLVASLSPPKPYNDFSLVSADAVGGEYVLGAVRYWQGSASSGPQPRAAVTPMKFEMLRITQGGHAQLSGLSLPEKVTPGQLPSIALSPDGTRLAMAVGGGPSPAIVRVITLATGRQQQWEWQDVQWTPQLNSNGAWTANGRTLAFSEWFYPTAPTAAAISSFHPPGTARVHLLDTAVGSTGPASERLVVLHPPAGEAPVAQTFMTPDGSTLIATVVGRLMSGNGTAAGALATYSVRTGARISTVARWSWQPTSRPGHGGVPRQAIAWSDASGGQMVVLQPWHDLNILGVVAAGTFSTASALLPRRLSGYAELQGALRTSSQLAW